MASELKLLAQSNHLAVPFRPADRRQPLGASDDLHRGAIQGDLSCALQLGGSLPGHIPGAGVNLGAGMSTMSFVGDAVMRLGNEGISWARFGVALHMHLLYADRCSFATGMLRCGNDRVAEQDPRQVAVRLSVRPVPAPGFVVATCRYRSARHHRRRRHGNGLPGLRVDRSTSSRRCPAPGRNRHTPDQRSPMSAS